MWFRAGANAQNLTVTDSSQNFVCETSLRFHLQATSGVH
jgi:hypothetical protein